MQSSRKCMQKRYWLKVCSFAEICVCVYVLLQELTQQTVPSYHPPPLGCRPIRPCELLWCPGKAELRLSKSEYFGRSKSAYRSKKISLYALQNICVYFICCRFKYIIVYHSTSDKWGYQKRNPFAAPIIQKYPIQVPSVSAYPVCPFVCQHPDWLPWCSRGQNCRVRTALAMQPQACTSSDPETLHPQMKTWIHISTMFNEGLSRQIERHQVAQHTCGT